MKAKKLVLLLLVAVLALVSITALACTEKEKPEGPETGVYSCVVDGSTYLLNLNSGDKFTLITDSSKSGTYELTDNKLTLTFNKEEDGVLEAQYKNTTIVLKVDNIERTFYKQIAYKVTFDAQGGTAASEYAEVKNGGTVKAPADPTREGYKFLGWYNEPEGKTPFGFETEIITGNKTVYAKWVETKVGEREYIVDLYVGEGATNPNSARLETVGGIVATTLVAPTKEGSTFQGWWISTQESADKLSYEWTPDMKFAEDTTLFALWSTSGSAFLPQVSESGITWNAISGVSTYVVEIKTEAGEVVDSYTATNEIKYDFDWSAQAEGNYVISVKPGTGEAVTRYYRNKALKRVSNLTVVGNVFSFAAVDNAERYYIDVECGNPLHNHNPIDNGLSNTYNFVNCPMGEEGIKFTVTAWADGYAESVSKTFVYERRLDAIENIIDNAEEETIYWDVIPNATSYVLSILCEDGTHTHVVNNGNKTSYCYKECTGKVTINVTPYADGYISPAYAKIETKQDRIAAPKGIKVVGNLVQWDAVSGADKYTIYVGDQRFDATTNEYNISSALTGYADGDTVKIIVIAHKGSASSLESNVASFIKGAMYGTIKYYGGEVSWRHVLGAEEYIIKVNKKEVARVNDGSNFAKITLTGYTNTITVSYVDQYGAESAGATIVVEAHAIYFDSQGGEPVATVYRAVGDMYDLPTTTKPGYEFNGWYNVPGASQSNGAEYNSDDIFNETGDITLFADWQSKEIGVEFVYGDDVTVTADSPTTATVLFGKNYTLPVPQAENSEMLFIGWTTIKDSFASHVTNEIGESLKVWSILESNEGESIKLYPYFERAFLFSHNDDDTYSVTKNADGMQKVEIVTIPTMYNGQRVTEIVDFRDCASLKQVRIPQSMLVINTNAFGGCTKLESFVVYEVDGSLLLGDFASLENSLVSIDSSNVVTLKYAPYALSGSYKIPVGVNEIDYAAVSGRTMTEVVIPSTVSYISTNAFEGSPRLANIVFDENGPTVNVADGAFANCASLRNVQWPARAKLSGVAFADVFDGCTNLININITSGNPDYESVDGVVLTKDRSTLVFYPNGRQGAYTNMPSVYAIADKAFYSVSGLTEVVINNTVTEIGEYAFASNPKLTKVTLGNGVITIGDFAFYNCTALATVEIDVEQSRLRTIGEYAFANGSKQHNSIQDMVYWNRVLDNIQLPDTVVSIGSHAFWQASKAIVTLNVPNIEYIGEGAFYNNTSMQRADISNVKEMGARAFQFCTSLVEATISEDSELKAIPDYAFNGCSSLKYIVVPNSVTTIGMGAYTNCGNVLSLTLGKSLQGVGAVDNDMDGAFYGLTSIVEVKNMSDKNLSTFGIKVQPLYTYGEDGASRLVSTEDGFVFYFETSKVYLVDYAENESEVVTPDKFVNDSDEYDYEIYSYAFYNATSISRITISAGVTKINDNAFVGCNIWEVVNLSSLNITAGATDNGRVAANAKYVYNSAEEDSKLDIIDGFVFDPSKSQLIGYTFDTEVVVLPENYKGNSYTLAAKLFEGKIASDITINGVDNIEATLIGATANATNTTIKKLTINGTGKTTIATQTFWQCKALEEVVIGEGVTTLGDSVFRYNTALVKATIGNDVTTLGNYTFSNCEILESVTLSNSLTKIGTYTFYYCYLLDNVVLPDSLTNETTTSGNIGTYTFGYCTSLKNVTIGNAIKVLPNYTFYSCSALENITLPESVQEIGNSAFGSCTSLRKVVIPDTITKLGSSVFSSCSALNVVVVGKNVQEIGSSSFSSCYKLREVYNLSGLQIEAGATTHGGIAQYAMVVYNTLMESTIDVTDDGYEFMTLDGKAYLVGYQGDNMAVLVLPQDYNGGKYEVGNYAFYDVQEIRSVSISSNVTRIGTRAFSKGTSGTTGYIVSVEIPEGVEEIGEYAFYYQNMSSLKIPDSVKTIGNYAFQSNKLITKLDLGNGVETIGNSAFNGLSLLTQVVFPASIQSFGSQAFYGCTLLYEIWDLTSLNITKGATTNGYAGYYAKIIHTSLDEDSAMVVVDGFTILKDSASGTASLIGYNGVAGGRIVFPEFEYNYDIAANLFQENKNITSVKFSDSVSAIGNYVFDGCSALTSVEFGANITTTGQYTFRNCTSLSSVTFNEGLTTIDAYSFQNDTALETVIIPDSVTKLGNYAFRNCTGIKTLVIGNGVTSVGMYSLSGLGVTKIYYHGTSSEWSTKIPSSQKGTYYIDQVPVLYFSDTSASGCWHFGNNGMPEEW